MHAKYIAESYIYVLLTLNCGPYLQNKLFVGLLKDEKETTKESMPSESK